MEVRRLILSAIASASFLKGFGGESARRLEGEIYTHVVLAGIVKNVTILLKS
jgi:hypothetical protein